MEPVRRSGDESFMRGGCGEERGVDDEYRELFLRGWSDVAVYGDRSEQ